MSTRRDLIYRMTADPEGFKKGMREAGQDSNLFYRELKKLEKQQQAVDQVMTTTGTVLLGFGAAAGAGLALAAKAAIDWESAWTGVAKVVDGSPEQLAALEDELRGLATTLPQTHAEIAGVAAAAGQLGVATEDLAGFTRVMVDLGTATNISSEEAAFSLSRLMNIMQTAPDHVSNLGSAIVDLGNNSATTEADIVAMALRIAGAGQQIGLSEADVLAYSAALSSVGVEAEAGGTAISLAFKKIDGAVREGGDTLEGFAQVAGMSGEDFRRAYQDDAAGAIQTFVAGLGRMNESGGDVFGTLSDLGLTGERLQDSLLRLSGAGDLLNETLETSSTAWTENSALVEEAARRYETTEAQMQIARNQIVDLGIDLGEMLLPTIREFLDAGTGLLEFFSGLPEPVKQAVVVLGTVTTVVGLVGGAALIAVPKIHAFNRTLGEIGTGGAIRAQRGLNAVTNILMGPWGVAIGATIGVLTAFAAKHGEAESRIKEFADTLDKETGALTEFSREWVALQLIDHDDFGQGFIDDMRTMGIETSLVTDAILGVPGAMDELNEKLDESEFSTAAEDWKGRISELSGEVEEGIQRQEEFAAATDETTGSTEAATEATEGASAAEQVLAEQLGITTEAAEGAAEGFDDLDEKVRALIDSSFALAGAERDVEASVDDLTGKLEENGATLDRSTEAGRENEEAIEALVTDIADLALTTAEQTGSTEKANKVLEEEKERLRDVLEAAGFTEDQIEDYIATLDRIPEEIQTAVEANVRINVTGQNFIATDRPMPRAEGGITYHAQQGLLREAGVFSPVFPARFAFAEPETGGEAFVPRLGDRSRSLGILQEAAAWHRASVVPNESGGGGQTINVNLSSYSREFSTKQVLDDLQMRSAS